MNSETTYSSPVDRMYPLWDEALSHNDPEELLVLYAPDGTSESPLIPHLMGSERGICRGHDEMRPFFEAVAREKPQIPAATIAPATLATEKSSCGSIHESVRMANRWTLSR